MKDSRDFFPLQNENRQGDAALLEEAKTSPKRIEVGQSFFIDLGCAVWKLRQKMFDPVTGQAKEDFSQLARYVGTICERLADLGLQIQDHTGNPFDSGQSLEVLAFQPTNGILSETVIETVRPTLYLGDQRILKGQVIVGTPDRTPSGKESQC